ncbi:3-deoxy-D-manno-octulosonate cytidylyltransferase [Helicobacter enhydrae]|uniref:3-deoxy-D-manno-octulosonate cytidylyltransferase n=1 Tax=Helicobacter enhydrae TaxID=222136 RepID=A0A1B1U3U0_9HELI|nr:3-deoxy-manno-octulosonate cytidylyltransferase [Helicobacter enhydrae]ANV97392.1 3-deoxy-D-manno-octulosonate cytidylyltransferase [Helicobacter enhydrae]
MIIIPARLHSTRFPQKMLSEILGIPLIVRTALRAQEVDEVVVATDSKEIAQICESYHIEAILTKETHSSGTDRCAEAVEILRLEPDEIVINMQGDEPFLEAEILSKLKNLMQTSTAFMGTCIKSIAEDESCDPNLVKVVLDSGGNALYFSRSKIPYNRDQAQCEYFGHLGVYGFKAKHLLEFCALPKSPLEEIEKLEQLRALYHQKRIETLLVETQSIGIDTAEDRELAIQRFLKA